MGWRAAAQDMRGALLLHKEHPPAQQYSTAPTLLVVLSLLRVSHLHGGACVAWGAEAAAGQAG